jgi:hypothetical protein
MDADTGLIYLTVLSSFQWLRYTYHAGPNSVFSVFGLFRCASV